MAPSSPSGSAAASSSGFSSSDEDDEHEQIQYERTSTTVSVSSVRVDIIEEDENENDAVTPSTDFTSLDDGDDEAQLQDADLHALAQHVGAQCMQTVKPLLQGPLSFHYEQFTAAIELVTRNWPITNEDEDDDEEQNPKVMAYRALRTALYARFQKAFPLTPEMYAQWLSDLSERDVRTKQRVFELSMRDYQSVPLALQYAQFLHDNEGKAGLPTTESIMERMLRTVGTHYTLGHEVWKFYREIIQHESEQAPPLVKEQRVRAFYARQMTLPLQQNDLVMSEFRAWNNYNTLETDTKRSEQLFVNAVKRQTKGFGPLMKKMNQFEERLQAAVSGHSEPDEVPLDQIWLQYIHFVTYRIVPLIQTDEETDEDENGAFTIGGDDLLKCMFERAVAIMCLSSTLWTKYIAFLSGSASDASDAEKLALYQRAVRNVSFDSSMWNDLLLEMERQSASIVQLTGFFTHKIASRTNPLMMDAYHFLSVLITYCDIHRREAARKKFNHQAMQHLEQAFQLCEQFCVNKFPEFPLGRTRIMEYHAKCSLLGFTSVTNSRQPATKFAKWNALWEQILQLRGQEAEVWASYYQESLRTGAKPTAQEIRSSVFQRAMQVVTDYPASIVELWLVFERENGTLADFLHVRQLHTDFAAKAADAVTAASAAAAAPVAQPEPRKRKAVDAKSKPEPKRAKPAPASRSKEDEPKSKVQQQQPAAKKAVALPEKLTEKKKTHEALTNAHTLFASNISKDVTKEELDALFQDIPGFKEVRLVVKARANHIKSRGMAYIQFSDEQGVAAGLLKDGLELKGQAMSIVQSKPPQNSATAGDAKGKNGDLSRDGTWKTDPVTIYVGGLVQRGENGGEHIGEAKLQEGIQQALQSVGELVVVKRVSILKDKRGKLKDYGLVEVAAPEQTAKCVDHLEEIQKILGDQVTLKPSRFSIDQILLQQQNQMKKKETTDPARASGEKQKKPKGHGAAAGGTGAPQAVASKPRTNTMSLMPRALRRKQLAVSADASSVSALKANSNATSSLSSALTATTASSSTQQTTQPSATSSSDNRPKTNDDFRKLMMKQ